ncbi:hypothetical protein [Gryllotalpicola protaetiae]|uniref:SRPBCC family protein n=1 Tax=Gryllotalpicola protaetiae TaxID=2419771 RepID=A0A387BPR3_9MICO|nr:hypothetical protein [Gryllotalpicola protaetiae]AYG03099.1 hypothetical protein D7I44_05855 [Gryllotalpicola protaetiae]
MSTVSFHLDSRLTAPELMRVLTDFGPARADAWPTIDAAHFQVHTRGADWAEVTEGTASAWERSRYEWDEAAGRVEITTHESKVFGVGGGWVFQLTPQAEGTRVDVRLDRPGEKLAQKLAARLLPFVAPASLAKSFRAPLQAK